MTKKELTKLVEEIVDKALSNKLDEVSIIAKTMLGENTASLKNVVNHPYNVIDPPIQQTSKLREMNESVEKIPVITDRNYPPDYDPLGLVKDYRPILEESKKRGKLK